MVAPPTVMNFLTRLTDDKGEIPLVTERAWTRRADPSFGGGRRLCAARRGAVPERFEKGRAHLLLARRILDLLAGQVGDVEGIDHLLAEGGDVGGSDIE